MSEKTYTTAQDEQPDPVIYIQNATRREARLFKIGAASHVLADFTHDKDACCYTFGQFSLIDAVAVLLEKTGPANIDVCVWTVAAADMIRMQQLTEHHKHRIRWVIDQGFQSRTPEHLERLRNTYGDEQIRTIRAHAKFITIGNDAWHIVIRTSMNLNRNTRFEHLDVTDDPGLHDWHTRVVDGIFATEPAGVYASKPMTDIDGVTADRPPGMIRTGTAHIGEASKSVINGGKFDA